MSPLKPAIPFLMAAIALPAAAQMATPSAKQFIAKAGASDAWEIKEAKLMQTSANPGVSGFAKQMITDHGKSTAMVKAAAKQDRVMAGAPMLSAKQNADYAKLAAAKGKARDTLYLSQQKAAHAEAQALMQSYSTGGTAPHLKDAAGQILPVVQGHIAMLDKMG